MVEIFTFDSGDGYDSIHVDVDDEGVRFCVREISETMCIELPREQVDRLVQALLKTRITEFMETLAGEIDLKAHPDSEWARERREGRR